MNYSIFFVGGQKNEYFLGYDEIVDILGGSPQIWTIFLYIYIFFFLGGGGRGVISIHFRACSYSQGTVFECFWGFANFQIFLGMPDILGRLVARHWVANSKVCPESLQCRR